MTPLFESQTVNYTASAHSEPFHARLPSRSRDYPPLPKRTSPKPWDFSAERIKYLETMRKNGISEAMHRPDKPVNENWRKLTVMNIGDSITVTAPTLTAVQNAVRTYQRIMRAVFTVKIDSDGAKRITRVG